MTIPVNDSTLDAMTRQLAREVAMQNKISQIQGSAIYAVEQAWIMGELSGDADLRAVNTEQELDMALQSPANKRILLGAHAGVSISMLEEKLKASPLSRLVFVERS